MSEFKNDEEHKHHHRGKSSESILDKNTILSNITITPGQTVLDAGCGDGYMSKEFAKLAGETGKIYALDPDPTAIETLKSETKNTIIEPFVGDITEETKLAASSINFIYLSTVIHGFSKAELQGLVNEVKRLLKPKGKLAIIEIKKEETPFGPPLEIRLSPEELKQTINLTPILLIDVAQFFYMQIFEK